MRSSTETARRRLYAEATAIVATGYRRPLTLSELAATLASSPRQIQRAYAQFGQTSFREDLRARRLAAAAELLTGQPALSIEQVARLVGYSRAPPFAAAFRARYGRTPGEFRAGVPDSSRSSSRSRGAGSRPGRRSRINVPPPGAGSAVTAPPS